MGTETALRPRNWRSRVVEVENDNTGGVRGLCLGPADLAVSKLLAGRDKDLAFVRAMLAHGLVAEEEITALLPELEADDRVRLALALRRCRR